jgi:hypothetical protein
MRCEDDSEWSFEGNCRGLFENIFLNLFGERSRKITKYLVIACSPDKIRTVCFSNTCHQACWYSGKGLDLYSGIPSSNLSWVADYPESSWFLSISHLHFITRLFYNVAFRCVSALSVIFTGWQIQNASASEVIKFLMIKCKWTVARNTIYTTRH